MSAADDLLKQLIWARIALTSIETFAEHLGATFRESAAALDKLSTEEKAELLSVARLRIWRPSLQLREASR